MKTNEYFKALDNRGRMVHGGLVFDREGKPFIGTVHLLTQVNPKTVCRNTGITDSNGKDIYDGDIIQVNGKPYHQIKWLDEIGGFGLCNLVTKRNLSRWPDRCLFGIPAQDWWNEFSREIVVVGNVFDNPDYLEKFVEP